MNLRRTAILLATIALAVGSLRAQAPAARVFPGAQWETVAADRLAAYEGRRKGSARPPRSSGTSRTRRASWWSTGAGSCIASATSRSCVPGVGP